MSAVLVGELSPKLRPSCIKHWQPIPPLRMLLGGNKILEVGSLERLAEGRFPQQLQEAQAVGKGDMLAVLRPLPVLQVFEVAQKVLVIQ